MVQRDREYPSILFIHQGTPRQGEEFFNEFWPEARAVSDPEKALYRGFGVGSASLRQMMGPGVWLRAIRTMSRHGVGRPVGDPRLMPGLFLAARGRILWTWRFRNIGDHPDFDTLSTVFSGMVKAAVRP